jgi:hypothetical protein
MTIPISNHCQTCVESVMDIYPSVKDSENYRHYANSINSINLSSKGNGLSCSICGSHMPDENQKSILQLFYKIITEYQHILPIKNDRIQLREEALHHLGPVLEFLKLEKEKKEG